MSKLKYGYQWQAGQIVINPAQAEVIKQIFAGFLTSQTRNQLARQFNLTHTTILRILTSNKYAGAEDYPQIISTTDFKQVQKSWKSRLLESLNSNQLRQLSFTAGLSKNTRMMLLSKLNTSIN